MGDFLPPQKNTKESATLGVPESTSVAPSATSIAGAVTPGRTHSVDESSHQRPVLAVGNSPSAHSALAPSAQPGSNMPMPQRQIPMGTGNQPPYFSANQSHVGPSGYIENTQGWGAPPPGPPQSGMAYPPQQYHARQYYPPANSNRPPQANQPQYQRYTGN